MNPPSLGDSHPSCNVLPPPSITRIDFGNVPPGPQIGSSLRCSKRKPSDGSYWLVGCYFADPRPAAASACPKSISWFPPGSAAISATAVIDCRSRGPGSKSSGIIGQVEDGHGSARRSLVAASFRDPPASRPAQGSSVPSRIDLNDHLQSRLVRPLAGIITVLADFARDPSSRVGRQLDPGLPGISAMCVNGFRPRIERCPHIGGMSSLLARAAVTNTRSSASLPATTSGTGNSRSTEQLAKGMPQRIVRPQDADHSPGWRRPPAIRRNWELTARRDPCHEVCSVLRDLPGCVRLAGRGSCPWRQLAFT